MTDTVSDSVEQVAKVFAGYQDADDSYSAQLCVYRGDEIVLDLACGELGDRGLLPVFSSTKASIAVVVGRLLESDALDLDATVAHYWPEFAAAGKERVTVRQMLSHQAGLVGVDRGFTFQEWLAHDPLAQRLAAQRPYWVPGAAHGYHALTIGVLADELIRRITGQSLAAHFTALMSEREVDMHLGLPDALDVRAHEVRAPAPEDFARLTPPPYSPLDLEAETGLRDAPADFWNDRSFWRVGPPAAGGLATAAGLARLYACIRHDLGAPRLLGEDTISQLRQLHSHGSDLTLGKDTRFGVVFELPNALMRFGTGLAYGHDGAGGSLGFDDPGRDISLGYVVQRMPAPFGCDPRALELVSVLTDCLAESS